MKVAQIFVVAVALFACVGPSLAAKPIRERKNDLYVVKKVEPLGEGALCSLCDQFVSQGINQLLNIVLNAGVIGSCSELCSLAFKDAKSSLLPTVCNLACDAVGVYGFINLINKFSKVSIAAFVAVETLLT